MTIYSNSDKKLLIKMVVMSVNLIVTGDINGNGNGLEQ